MTFLIASQILSWIAIAGLGLLCLALARQVGVLHERIAPAGALAINAKLKVGDPAPRLSVQSIDGRFVSIGEPAERSQLLFFMSPDCPVCRKLLPALTAAAHTERAWLDVALVSDGEGPDHQAYVREHGLGRFPYIVSELTGRSFSVGKLPYAVLIDESGRIASMGLVNSREHLDSLFRAKELGVASLQEFLTQRESRSSNVTA